jgi:hypothetical protein
LGRPPSVSGSTTVIFELDVPGSLVSSAETVGVGFAASRAASMMSPALFRAARKIAVPPPTQSTSTTASEMRTIGSTLAFWFGGSGAGGYPPPCA